MAIEMTAELNEKILQVKKQLPEGFDIVSNDQLNDLIEQKKDYEYVFLKLLPLIQGAKDLGNNPMAAIQKLGPAVQELQNDATLNETIQRIAERLA